MQYLNILQFTKKNVDNTCVFLIKNQDMVAIAFFMKVTNKR